MNKHVVSPEMTDIMKSVINNAQYNLATLQHADWDDSTCIFDLSHRNKFIERILTIYDSIPTECGFCMYYHLGEVSRWIKEVCAFYDVNINDRFGEAFQAQLSAAIEPHSEDIIRLLKEKVFNGN